MMVALPAKTSRIFFVFLSAICTQVVKLARTKLDTARVVYAYNLVTS